MKKVHFGNTLMAAMEAQDIIAADLARLMDVHPQQMSDWCNKQNATTITEARVARALGLTMAEFWEFSEA